MKKGVISVATCRFAVTGSIRLAHSKERMQEFERAKGMGLQQGMNLEILTPEEVAQYLRKSTSWVYKNWQALGGRKLGGSLFFPRKEDLYERLFCKRQGQRVEVRFHPEGDQAQQSLVQNKNGGQTGRSKKKGGAKKSKTDGDNPNRYGLLDIG